MGTGTLKTHVLYASQLIGTMENICWYGLHAGEQAALKKDCQTKSSFVDLIWQFV